MTTPAALRELADRHDKAAKTMVTLGGLPESDERVQLHRETATQLRAAAGEGGEADGQVVGISHLHGTYEIQWFTDKLVGAGTKIYLTHPPEVARDAGRWLPIESAPMDGTEILGYRDGKIAKAYRIQRDDCEMWWFGGSSGAIKYCPDLKPTHWRQIPASPEEQDAALRARADDAAISGVAGEKGRG